MKHPDPVLLGSIGVVAGDLGGRRTVVRARHGAARGRRGRRPPTRWASSAWTRSSSARCRTRCARRRSPGRRRCCSWPGWSAAGSAIALPSNGRLGFAVAAGLLVAAFTVTLLGRRRPLTRRGRGSASARRRRRPSPVRGGRADSGGTRSAARHDRRWAAAIGTTEPERRSSSGHRGAGSAARQSDADHNLAVPSSLVRAASTRTGLGRPHRHRHTEQRNLALRGSIAPPGPASTVSSARNHRASEHGRRRGKHGVLTYDTRAYALRREPHGDLVRQAYLLTGDPARAHASSPTAPLASSRGARTGSVPPRPWSAPRKNWCARTSPIPARPPPVAAGGPTPHPDVAMWRGGLPARAAPPRRHRAALRRGTVRGARGGAHGHHAAAAPRGRGRGDADAAYRGAGRGGPVDAGRRRARRRRPRLVGLHPAGRPPGSPRSCPHRRRHRLRHRDTRTGPPPCGPAARSPRPDGPGGRRGRRAAAGRGGGRAAARRRGRSRAARPRSDSRRAGRHRTRTQRPATRGAEHRRRRRPAELAGARSAVHRPDPAGRGDQGLEGRRAGGRGAGERGHPAVGRSARPARGRGAAGPRPGRPAAPGAGARRESRPRCGCSTPSRCTPARRSSRCCRRAGRPARSGCSSRPRRSSRTAC